jgi:prepilin-type N-terminal cleavage/methylation domain-containing protein
MRPTRDDGFTVIELLIALTVSGLILAPLAAAIFVGFRTTGDTQTRLAQSDSANVLAAYFIPDVQNASILGFGATQLDCGSASGPVDIALTWLPYQAASSTVGYYTADVGGKTELRRRVCRGDDIVAEVKVLGNVTGGVTPACVNSAGGACNGSLSDWRSVTLAVTQQAPGDSPYQTTLTASRRIT